MFENLQNSFNGMFEKDAGDVSYVLEVTHCDEIDREKEFRQLFKDVSFRDTPLV